MTTAALFKHSPVGTLVHYARTGTLSFSRQNIKTLAFAFSSTENITAPVDEHNVEGRVSRDSEVIREGDEKDLEKEGELAPEIKDKNLVTWDGDGEFLALEKCSTSLTLPR